MEIYLILFIAYFLYSDIQHRREIHRKDDMIKDLELKFLSKNVEEYKRGVDKPPAEMEDEKDPYVPIEEVEPETALRATENL